MNLCLLNTDPELTPHEQFAKALDIELEIMRLRLLVKNRQYGNSVIEPVRIFSKASPIEQINVRIDDKISRILSGQMDEDEDAEFDLEGYLLIKRIYRRLKG